MNVLVNIWFQNCISLDQAHQKNINWSSYDCAVEKKINRRWGGGKDQV